MQQLSFGAVCVRIGGLRLILFVADRRRCVLFGALVQIWRGICLHLFVSFVQVLFAPDAVCVQAAADFVEFYKKG